MSHELHLVGSVPLDSASEVFTTMSKAFGKRLKYIPDGETGERLDWITWLEPIFSKHPAFEASEEKFQIHSGVQKKHTRYKLKPGVRVEDVRFENLYYADNALASYAVFADLKRGGEIEKHSKFQVDLVPAHSVIWLFVQENLHPP